MCEFQDLHALDDADTEEIQSQAQAPCNQIAKEKPGREKFRRGLEHRAILKKDAVGLREVPKITCDDIGSKVRSCYQKDLFHS
jgi:hypothetical protein